MKLACLLFLLAQAPSSLTATDTDATLERLVAAYPEFLTTGDNPRVLLWKDGTRMVYDDGAVKKDFEELLNRASLHDQMSIPYPAGWPPRKPELNEDPGRLRYEPFFRKMYGDTQEQVEDRLVDVPWPSANASAMVKFSSVNGASEALRAVGEELARETPEVRRYVARPNGTFVWRPIAQTGRLSMHSFGVAIDFELPVKVSTYWQWERDRRGKYVYPDSVLTDESLGCVVKIFEKHGFIWGGKWYHYDLMHFEYRPELVPPGREAP